MLLLFEFYFSSCTNFEDCYTAGQLGQTLLELFAVVVRISVLNFSLQLANAALDVVFRTGTFDDGCFIFCDDNLLCCSQQVKSDIFKLETNFFADDLATSKNCDVLQHCFTTVTETRSLNSNALECSANLVNNQSCKCFTFNVFSNDDQRASALHYFFKYWQHVAHVCDLA